MPVVRWYFPGRDRDGRITLQVVSKVGRTGVWGENGGLAVERWLISRQTAPVGITPVFIHLYNLTKLPKDMFCPNKRHLPSSSSRVLICFSGRCFNDRNSGDRKSVV